MAKLTLLEIVQDIMNDMDSDEVNSISDTEESSQIAQIVKTTYFEILGRRDWPHLSKFTNLNSISDYLKVFNNINKRPAQEPRNMAHGGLTGFYKGESLVKSHGAKVKELMEAG